MLHSSSGRVMLIFISARAPRYKVWKARQASYQNTVKIKNPSDLDIKAIASLSPESKCKVSYPTQYSHFDSYWFRPTPLAIMHPSYVSLAIMAVGAAAAPSYPKPNGQSDPFNTYPFMSGSSSAVEDDDGMDNSVPAYMEAMQLAESAQGGNYNSAPASSQPYQQPAQQAKEPAPTFQQAQQEAAPTFQAPQQEEAAPTFQAPQADPAPSFQAPQQEAAPTFQPQQMPEPTVQVVSEPAVPQPTHIVVVKPDVVAKPHKQHSEIPAAAVVSNIAPAPLSDPVPPMQMPTSTPTVDDMPLISEAPMISEIEMFSAEPDMPETYSSSFSTEAVVTIAPIPKPHQSVMSSMVHSVMQTPMSMPMPEAKTSSSHSMMLPVLPQPSTHSVMMQSTPTHQIIVTMSTKARPTHSVMIHEQHLSSNKVHATPSESSSASASVSASASATPSASADAANPLGALGGMLKGVPILGGLLGSVA